jgi:NDP-sugar pyrophosphorylase family protein
MLLAAGLGTRLRPLTELRPKPIVPVANRPLAAFAMEHLAASGVDHIVANTHPQPELVESALAAACPPGVQLRFSRETGLLGTGGGVLRAQRSFQDREGPVVVMNGDTLFAPDLEGALEAHRAGGAVATMILRQTPEPERFGAIGIDNEGWVRTLLGEPAGVRAAKSLMFTGVHILSPEAFPDLPECGCIIRHSYRRWVDRGAPIVGFVDDSPWADLGTVSEYHRLNLELASGSFRWPGVEPRGGCILPESLDALETVQRSILGDGVRLDDGVTLDECVVWPGTRVARSATRSVLTPEHRIEIS